MGFFLATFFICPGLKKKKNLEKQVKLSQFPKLYDSLWLLRQSTTAKNPSFHHLYDSSLQFLTSFECIFQGTMRMTFLSEFSLLFFKIPAFVIAFCRKQIAYLTTTFLSFGSLSLGGSLSSSVYSSFFGPDQQIILNQCTGD